MKPYINAILICALFFICMPQLLTAQWSTNSNINNAICTITGSEQASEIASDGCGGAIIVWHDQRNRIDYDIYAQRIDAYGVVQWTVNGIAVCTAAGGQFNPVIISDNHGGAIITWQDFRTSSNCDIYAQRINSHGESQWTENGVAICTATNAQDEPEIISDGSDGAIIAWIDHRDGVNIYAQRINSSGSVQWTTDGVALCTAAGLQYSVIMATDCEGGAIAAWEDNRNSGNSDIYTQRISAEGIVRWTADGIAICAAVGNQRSPAIVSDGIGGAIITWYDMRGTNSDIYAQRINTNGTVQWAPNGAAVCRAAKTQLMPKIVSDGINGAIIAWQDYRNDIRSDIYVQRLNASGRSQWTANGVAICTAEGQQDEQIVINDNNGGAIIMWNDFRAVTSDIYAQKIFNGIVQWSLNGIAVCTAAKTQSRSTAISDGSGGAILTWMDQRTAVSDIYSQRIDEHGNLYPMPWITDVIDFANDNGGKLIVLWNASNLDKWPNRIVNLYDVKLGVKSTTEEGGFYWQTAVTVTADWSDGYSAFVTTPSDSGSHGIPWYYFQIIGRTADGTTSWKSNIDSSYSVDNIH